MNFKVKPVLVGAIIFIGAILIAIFKFGFGGGGISIINNSSKPSEQVNTSEPQLISSNPPELFERKPMIFKPDQVIELNFNTKLENGPETKIVFDPPVEVKIELKNEDKTAVIKPVKPYKLGQGYTFFIKSDTKLAGGKTLGKEYNLTFNVINYSGI